MTKMNPVSAPAPTASAPVIQPTWHRVLEVISGILAIAISAAALIDPVLGAGLLVFLFAFALLWLGLWRLTRGIDRKDRPRWHRVLDGVFGGLSIVFGFVVVGLPGLGLITLVILLYIALFFLGITWFGYATQGSAEPKWYRGLAACLGVLCIVMAFVALVFPGTAILTLVLLFAVVLLLVGLGDLVSGVTGRQYRMVTPPSWLPKTG